jgi:excisionase family DNA binding protein
MPAPLTSAQVARKLGKSVRTINRMAAAGNIPADKMPGRTGAYLFDANVIDYIATRKEAS